jgi:ribonuclease Y
LEEARREAEEIRHKADAEAKEEISQRQKRFERDMTRRRIELERDEQKLQKRESAFDKKFDSLERREQSLAEKESRHEKAIKALDDERLKLDEKLQEAIQRCEAISGMTAEQAKQALLDSLETEVKQESAALIRRLEGEARESAAKKARQIITLAIQKFAA